MAKTLTVFPCLGSTTPLPPSKCLLFTLTFWLVVLKRSGVWQRYRRRINGFRFRNVIENLLTVRFLSPPFPVRFKQTIVGFAMSACDVIISPGPWPNTGVSRPSIWWVSHGSVVIVYCGRRLSRVIIIIITIINATDKICTRNTDRRYWPVDVSENMWTDHFCRRVRPPGNGMSYVLLLVAVVRTRKTYDI